MSVENPKIRKLIPNLLILIRPDNEFSEKERFPYIMQNYFKKLPNGIGLLIQYSIIICLETGRVSKNNHRSEGGEINLQEVLTFLQNIKNSDYSDSKNLELQKIMQSLDPNISVGEMWFELLEFIKQKKNSSK